MTRTEKSVAAIVGVYVLRKAIILLSTPATTHLLRAGFSESQIMGYVEALMGSLVLVESVLCACWLFVEAKKENKNKWVWSVFGFFTNLIGVILFFAYIMTLTKKTEPNQALEPTTTAVTDRAGARSAPAAVVAHL